MAILLAAVWFILVVSGWVVYSELYYFLGLGGVVGFPGGYAIGVAAQDFPSFVVGKSPHA